MIRWTSDKAARLGRLGVGIPSARGPVSQDGTLLKYSLAAAWTTFGGGFEPRTRNGSLTSPVHGLAGIKPGPPAQFDV
jgi:hypothetical protein